MLSLDRGLGCESYTDHGDVKFADGHAGVPLLSNTVAKLCAFFYFSQLAYCVNEGSYLRAGRSYHPGNPLMS